MLFSSIAHAQGAGVPQPTVLEQLMPFVFIFVIFYFLLIRPQQKRHKLHNEFLGKLQKGDDVLTASGIFGKIEGLTDKFVTLEVSDGVSIRVLRSQIASTAKEGNEK